MPFTVNPDTVRMLAINVAVIVVPRLLGGCFDPEQFVSDND